MFPDGVGHLLTPEGKVDPQHAMTDEDRAAEAESAEHVKGWHAAAHRIDLDHAANESAANEIESDAKLNAAINELPTADDAEGWAEEVSGDDELETEIATVMEALKDVESSESPDYPDRPDPDDYRKDISELDEDFDEPSERRDHLQALREDHETDADGFADASKEYREEAVDATTTFREEQTGYLEALQAAVADALKIPAQRWADAIDSATINPERGGQIRDELVKLGERVGAILKTLSPDA